MGKGIDLSVGNKIFGTVVGIKGKCNAGHEVGDKFELSCYQSDGLCGFFYEFLFARLSVMQFGGKFPWWTENQNIFEVECPDRKNAVSIQLEIIRR